MYDGYSGTGTRRQIDFKLVNIPHQGKTQWCVQLYDDNGRFKEQLSQNELETILKETPGKRQLLRAQDALANREKNAASQAAHFSGDEIPYYITVRTPAEQGQLQR